MTDEEPPDTGELTTNERVAWVLVAAVILLLGAQLAGIDPGRLPDPAIFASILTLIATLLVGRK